MSASAGRVLIIPKGDYNSATTYNMLDMVYFGGKSYICKQTSTGNDPTNTVYWQIMLDGASALNDLTDVNITDPQNGDGIAYNATTHKWENTSPVGIRVQTPPAQVDYDDGDILDLTGIIVMAEYSTGQIRNVTSECTFSPANGATLNSDIEYVTITWRTFSTTQQIFVKAPIYGVEWDGSSSMAWTRTDASASFVDPVPYYSGMTGTPSSPFDTISPWKDMAVVNYSSCGKVVSIPKFYYKWTRSGSSMKLQVSKTEFQGSHVSPAHADRGDNKGERDVVYVGRYHCASDYKSKTNSAPKVSITYATCISSIANLGTDVWCYDFAMFWTIMMLYLVEYASWNSQGKIGYGGGSSIVNSGYTDSMPYHTGTNQTSRSTYGAGTQYRYIEGLWDNCFDFLAGIYFGDSGKIYCQKNPSDFGVTNGVLVSSDRYLSNHGCIGEFSTPTVDGYEYVLYPSTNQPYTVGNPEYCPDATYNASSSNVVYVGGAPYTSQEIGAFSFRSMNNTSANGNVGCRLQKLP